MVKLTRRLRCTSVTIGLLYLLSCAASGPHPRRFAAVQNYWEWSTFWFQEEEAFCGAPYPSGQVVQAIEFLIPGEGVEHAFWGFCSEDLRLCQSYQARSDGVVSVCSHMRLLQHESTMDAMGRFFRRGLTGEESWRPPEGDPSELLRQMHIRRTRIEFQPLGVPQAVRQKRINPSIVKQFGGSPESASDGLRSRVPGTASSCRTVVPYSDEAVPFVPTLVDCAKVWGVQIWSKPLQDWIVTVGSWNPQPSYELVERIRENAGYICERPSVPAP